MHESSTLQSLTREECLRLMGSVPIGRIVFTQRALPAVRLVNFVLDGDLIVIRTAEGAKLAAAVRQAVVAFEADHVDFETHTGWSVTAIGHAREVTEPGEHSRLRALHVATWAPGPMDRFICVQAEIVSGRRLVFIHGDEQPA